MLLCYSLQGLKVLSLHAVLQWRSTVKMGQIYPEVFDWRHQPLVAVVEMVPKQIYKLVAVCFQGM